MSWAGLLAAAACGSPGADLGIAPVALSTVPIGAVEERSVAVPADVARVAVTGAGLSAVRLGGDAPSVRLRYAPDRPGVLEGTLTLYGLDEAALGAIEVSGAARAPTVDVWPAELSAPAARGEAGWASVWIWPETNVEIARADLEWPLCPRADSCLRALAPRAEAGLPAHFAVRLGPGAPSTLVLGTCDHPACEISIPVTPSAAAAPGVRCTPNPIELPAAAVDRPAEVTVRCEGAPIVASVTHPELSLEQTVADEVTLRWRPQRPGPMSTTLSVGPGHPPIAVHGYAVDAPDCALEIEPGVLVFGLTPVGQRRQAPLRAVNRGTDRCLVAAAVATPPGPFSTAPSTPQWIAPGTSIERPFTFEPDTPALFEAQAHFRVPSLDPAAGRAELVGQGVRAALAVVTERLDFGEIDECGALSRTIDVVNRGGATGWVQSILLEGIDADFVHIETGLPLEVPPGAQVEVAVRLSPDRAGPVGATATLELLQSDVSATARVELRGVGRARPIQEDAFTQLGLPKVDMLFVLDDGPGLAAEQAYLRETLTRLAVEYVAPRTDARFAVLATGRDDPHRADRLWPLDRPEAQVLSSTRSADLATELDALLGLPGAGSSTRNQGLEAALQALTSTATDQGQRFMREDAVLSIIYFTASDDASARTPDEYVQAFLQIKGLRNSNLLAISAVAGPPPDGCEDGGLTAAPATRYTHVAGHTGGVLQSICDRNWRPRLNTPSFGFKSRFFLSERPREDTIEVIVNGQALPARQPNGTVLWTYDYATNSLNFSPFGVPEPSAEILVRYQVTCGA